MKTEFCRFLTHGYSISKENNELNVRPCCWHRQPVKFENHTDARKSWSLQESWTPGCMICKQQEDSGSHSFRNASFDIIPDNLPPGPVALDINLDFNCNAACVICGPEFSSAWSMQLKKQKTFSILKVTDIDQLYAALDTLDLSNVRRIKFFGGEPLLTDTHVNVLNKMSNPGLIDIWYTTNGSILPDEKLKDIWSRFKLVFFEVSLDGVGKRFEYLRWPLTWHKVTNNLMELKETSPVNLLFRVNHTLNPFNVLYYDELENWVSLNLKSNRLGDLTEINIHPCWGIWDLNKTPESLRALVYEKYKNHEISNLLKLLPNKSYAPILEFTDQWDPIRGLFWQDVFPELTDYFPNVR